MPSEPFAIRDALERETMVLENLQRRSSEIWDAYRKQLAANPDAIELPQTFVDSGWVRVAVGEDDTRALAGGASRLEVTAGPATGFYECVAFTVVARAETRFGPAVRMRRELNS